MCLEYITGTGLNFRGKGYKVFDCSKGKIYPVYNAVRGRTLLLKQWLNEGDYRRLSFLSKIKSVYNGEYLKGWHLFTTKREAKEWLRNNYQANTFKIYKVRYTRGHTRGRQNGLEVVVAKEIYIEEEVK